MMDASAEPNESPEGALQTQIAGVSSAASVLRLDHSQPSTQPHVEPTSPTSRGVRLSSPSPQPEANEETSPSDTGSKGDPSAIKATATSSLSKAKVFLKNSSPDVPLHIFLPRELSHSLTRRLQITIRAHGGVTESRFGKADLIVVDPQLATISRKLLRDADRMGQPIPVVTYDYIQDSAVRGEKMDVEDPKYKYQPTLASNSVPAIRALNGRNAFTESDREAIVAYFIDKPESSWSLNAAAKELAASIPTHTQKSFQTYLQDNFEKGWSLKEKVLQARRAALETEPSELQARILRSQYTASPSLAEQSAPSDGWPRTSPAPPSQDSPAQRTTNKARTEAAEMGAGGASPTEDDDEEDLQVRHPNPGGSIAAVERSPIRASKPVIADASSEMSSPPTSPQPSDAHYPSIELPPEQQLKVPATPSVSEESDPEEFSPRIMSELRHLKSPLSKPSQGKKRVGRRTVTSSGSDDDSEVDQLHPDRDVLVTTSNAEVETEKVQDHADDSDDPEWYGTRAADKKLREKDTNRIKEVRVKFTRQEKDDLVAKLVDYVLIHGLVSDALEQETILARPEDAFWERVAADNPSHSAMSWKSHYLKNRPTYKQIIEYKLVELEDEGDEEEEEEEDYHDDGGSQIGEEAKDSQYQSKREHGACLSARQLPDKHANAARTSDQTTQGGDLVQAREVQNESGLATLHSSLDASIPDDGVVVLLPSQPAGADPLRSRLETQTRAAKPRTHPLRTLPVEGEGEEEGSLHDNYGVSPAPYPREDELAPSGEDSHGSAQDLDVLKTDSSVDATNSSEEQGNDAREVSAESRISSRSARAISSPWRPVQQRRSHVVNVGTPVLARHREAPFYDFSVDSDEEKRILRKFRSRPSLPNLQTRQQVISMASRRSPITTERVLGHFATPLRNQRYTSRGNDERYQRTREWARSVSASPPFARPEGIQPIVLNESSRSRASRIDRRPLPADVYSNEMYPARFQSDMVQELRHVPGRDSSAIPPTTNLAAAPTRPKQPHTARRKAQRPSLSDEEAARLEYRAEVERFRSNFGLNKEQLRELLMPFQASVKHARNHLESWLVNMEGTYGVDTEVALEYVKTSHGDFEQAEAYLKLAAITRSGRVQDRLNVAPSHSAPYTYSPVKRSARSHGLSFDYADRSSGRGNSSKRYRR